MVDRVETTLSIFREGHQAVTRWLRAGVLPDAIRGPAATATLGLNLLSFPIPPRDAGMVDGGPLVGAWYLGTTLIMIASLRAGGAQGTADLRQRAVGT